MPGERTKILVTGATGYIGGAVVDKFLARPDAPSLDIRAVVRSPEKGEKLKAFGITPIIGSHDDEDLMVKAASQVDVVLAMADSDDLAAAKATLKGLKKRFEETGKQPILINTSGTGTLADDAAGMYTTDTVYDDADPDQIETLPYTKIHRNVDLEIVAADKEGIAYVCCVEGPLHLVSPGYIRSYIILPSTIYSIAQGPLYEARISNPHSIQVPALIKAAIDRRQAGMVGNGVNVWPNVDIHELADLYSILYNSIIKNPDGTGHGREGYYFGANGEHSLLDVCRSIGEALVDLGIATSPKPTSFTKEEIDKYFGGSNFSENNSRCRANRSKSIGWQPKKTTEDLLKSIRPEVQAMTNMTSRPSN
ncbi:hypothetical protein PM082_016274 [Marasmius tenuissimus]|nr:hypothetical protein PM082_016274 [Marasmius tenuissimus]